MAELLFWPALLGLRRGGDRVRRRGAAPGAARPRRDLGRPARLAARRPRCCRAGGARRRLPVGDLGRLAQPLRLARRRGLPRLGLPHPLPPARARGDAARGGAVRRSPTPRGGTSTGATSSLPNLFLVLHVGLVLAAFAGFTLAAALSALYLWQERRLKRREPGILRVRSRRSSIARRLAAGRSSSRCPRSARDRRRARAAALRRRQRRRADGGDPAHLGGLRGLRRAPCGLEWRGRRAAYLALVGFALVVASSSASRRCTSDEARPRRPLAPPHADRAPRAGRALERPGRRALGELSADGGEAVCLSTCNRTELYLVGDDGRVARARRRSRTRRYARSPTGSTTRRRHSICSGSPRASTRSFRERARSSARCAARSRRARRGRCSTGSSARRCTRARRCGRRPRSRRARPRSRPRRRRSHSRCSATSTGAGCSSSARAR